VDAAKASGDAVLISIMMESSLSRNSSSGTALKTVRTFVMLLSGSQHRRMWMQQRHQGMQQQFRRLMHSGVSIWI